MPQPMFQRMTASETATYRTAGRKTVGKNIWPLVIFLALFAIGVAQQW